VPADVLVLITLSRPSASSYREYLRGIELGEQNVLLRACKNGSINARATQHLNGASVSSWFLKRERRALAINAGGR